MDTKLKLIHNAQAVYEQRREVAKQFAQVAATLETDAVKLMENVSEVLANIRAQLEGGKPLTTMSPDSAAAFLAGIDFIVKSLPNVKDKQNVDKVLNVLANVKMGSDGKITAGAASTIANLAHKNVDVWNQLKPMLASYGQTPKANQQLGATVAKLMTAVDHAQRLAQGAKPTIGQQTTQQPALQQAAPAAAAQASAHS